MDTSGTGNTAGDSGAVARYAGLGTAACVVVAAGAAALLFQGQADGAFWRGVIGAGVVAGFVAAPLLTIIANERRKFGALKSEVSRLSSVDALTSCLNGSVFASLIDAFRNSPSSRQGALLVVDIDDFRAINARFGHAWGDEVLKIVAGAIKSSVRGGDLVGRIGGEEFGVFLPGASKENAERVAERIRGSISDTVLEPGGRNCPLTVSVGAVLFDDQFEFDEMFRKADGRLTEAKARGRNRVEFIDMSDDSDDSDDRPTLNA
ncbi:diguanylate cyclase (plasmid) [Aminobacter sp. Y103A]|uniref:GGDEF domain-containing protein n=1 Tax=Aminobacter sp. Y103A TaxID=1870862 RepID=UPI00257292D3|nr:GGDEF domain-containing protein [Aminobacter sp. SS-2016]BBD40940.1 diguanylate cyclase [Aminobacter sp. SS-2016]